MRTETRWLRVAVVVACLAPTVALAQIPRALSDSAFAALVGRFSEPSGYFDTDNLISNEDSYLHPMGALRRVGVTGGVYIGVGPDQNFSYMAAIRPRAAVIIDIRRDNMLQHLLLKSIFAMSRNRVDYLSHLFGRPAPADTAGWGAKSVDSLLAYIVRTAPTEREVTRLRAALATELRRTRVALTAEDLATISGFHASFIAQGPALRFTTHGRAPSLEYPDFSELAAARDLEGRQRGFLGSEEAFQFVKDLQARNLVIPVVGNFGGTKAFAEVGKWMRANNERLSALYASNVEQYLFRDGLFDTFASSVSALPRDARSVIIRSCFNACRGSHSHKVAGFHSVQMVQLADTFAVLTRTRRFNNYPDLVNTGLLPP
jgi:hypothetical protein